MSETLPEPDPTLSSDAADSTYAEVVPEEETNPPSGPHVEQTLGKPAGAAKSPAKKASSTGSSD